MPEIYADWKSLKPLTAPVPVGTKCVVIVRLPDDNLDLGEVVNVTEVSNAPWCTNADGDDEVMYVSDLALLPADYQAKPKGEQPAPTKQERKVVQIAANGDVIVALCDDGIMIAFNGDQWRKLPPIPQD